VREIYNEDEVAKNHDTKTIERVGDGETRGETDGDRQGQNLDCLIKLDGELKKKKED